MGCDTGQCQCKLTIKDLQDAGVYVIHDFRNNRLQIGIPKHKDATIDPINDQVLDVWGITVGDDEEDS